MSNRAAPQFLLNMYIYIYIHIYIRKTYRNLYGTYPLKVKHAVCTTCKYVCALAKSSELCTRRRQFAYMSLLKLNRIACCSTPYHTIHSALAMASVFDCQYKMIHDVDACPDVPDFSQYLPHLPQLGRLLRIELKRVSD
jgi:hypothetical protein